MQPLLEARAGLAAQPQRRLRAEMLGPTQVAASIATRVVVSDTSDTWPPITPASDVGPSASEISAMSG